MSEILSKLKDHALQPEEKIDLIFKILLFRIVKDRFPSMQELKTLWEAE